jgi:hypothetical protein
MEIACLSLIEPILLQKLGFFVKSGGGMTEPQRSEVRGQMTLRQAQGFQQMTDDSKNRSNGQNLSDQKSAAELAEDKIMGR